MSTYITKNYILLLMAQKLEKELEEKFEEKLEKKLEKKLDEKLEKNMNMNKCLEFFTNDENKNKFYRFIAPFMDQGLRKIYDTYNYVKPVSDVEFYVNAVFGNVNYDIKLSTTYYSDMKYRIDDQGYGVYGNWNLYDTSRRLSDSAPEIIIYYRDTLDLGFYTTLLEINNSIEILRTFVSKGVCTKWILVVGDYDATNNISLDSIKNIFRGSNISILTLAELSNL